MVSVKLHPVSSLGLRASDTPASKEARMNNVKEHARRDRSCSADVLAE